jgi:peptidoglycan hydrolase-like protein with peptidoglycan-binding domain
MRRAATVAVVLLVCASGFVVWSLTVARPAATGNAAAVPVGTAPVTRGTVTQRIRIPGTYGFDGAYTVVHQGGPGIVTTTAGPGAVVERGGVLYTVDNRAVRLLYGDLPAYRDLGTGMSDGVDVRQLEQNLVDLGFDPSGQITVDDHFTGATSAAVRRWQTEWGVPAVERTGELTLGQVVFLPVALRVAGVSVGAGVAVGRNDPVLTASSTARVVTAQVGTDRQATVKVGDAVMVSLPSGAPLPGTILRVGRVANAGGSNGDGPNGGSGPATITIVVGLTAPAGLPDLDQAPVLVAVAANARPNVLLVPVAALLARPGGGYQVRKPGGQLVEVRPGLFDDATGKVEVTGALEVGDLVEVPVS